MNSTTREGGPFEQILGLPFFCGDAQAAVALMNKGGLLVVPAGPALRSLATDAGYREALVRADLVIADSGFMVLLWRLFEGQSIRKLSGLEYLRQLLKESGLKSSRHTFWIMASERSREINARWLSVQGCEVDSVNTYIAPMYGPDVYDPVLLERIRLMRPKHVMVTIGGGKQEQLGLYLKQHLPYKASIHCVGAAIGFLTGDQVRIPVWADKLYLGWLLRCISRPSLYVPRYWSARKLVGLLLKYRRRLPVDDERWSTAGNVDLRV